MATVRNPSFIELNGYYVEDEYARDRISEMEATGIDESYIDPDFAKEIKNAYVTPEMFGAVGDGVTNDIAAFVEALETGLPVILNNKNYYLGDNLTIGSHQTITSFSRVGENGARLTFASGKGVILDDRYCKLSNVTLNGSGTGSGITFSGSVTGSSYMTEVKDVIINDFENAFNIASTFWDNIIENVRINNCGTGIQAANAPTGSMVSVFKNMHFNHCTKNLNLNYGNKFKFDACNFGIDSFPSFNIESASIVNFVNCNFECDNYVESGTNMFTISTIGAKFEHCYFKVKAHADAHVFALYNTQALSFKNCVYEELTGNNMPSNNFFNIAHFNTADYAVVRFEGGNRTLPRPSNNLTTSLWPNWIDVEKGKPIEFYQTNIDKTKLTRGALLYSYTNQCLCFYDGTNVIKVTDGTVVI